MTVYVDAAEWTRATSKKPRKTYAHMVADTLEELHLFAAQIGVKKHFFHRAKILHYDITSDQQVIAISNGAVLADRKTILTVGKNMSK